MGFRLKGFAGKHTKEIHKVKRVILITTLALLVCVGLMTSSVVSSARAARAASNDDPQRINREFRAAMGQRLEFDLDTGGRIEVIGWDRELISVEVIKGGRDAAECRIDFQETAAGLRITSEYEGRGHSYSTNFTFTVRVPRRFDLQFDSMGGSLHICNVEGRISGKTMGGGLTLNNLKGDINLLTMGGGISLKDSEVEGKVETMGGRVLIENVVGDVRGSTMGGDVVRRNNGNRAGRNPETQCESARERDN
jgi:hypothetical protein